MDKYKDKYNYGRVEMSGMSEKGGSCLPSGHKVMKVEKMGCEGKVYGANPPKDQKEALKKQEAYMKKNS